MRSAFANEAVIFGRNRSEMVRDDKNDPVQSLDSPPGPTNSDGSHFLLSFLERLINKFGPFRDVSEIRVFRLWDQTQKWNKWCRRKKKKNLKLTIISHFKYYFILKDLAYHDVIRLIHATTQREEIMERQLEGKGEQYHGILLSKSTRQERRRTRDCSKLHWLRRRLQRKEKTQKKRERDDEQEEKREGSQVNIQRVNATG